MLRLILILISFGLFFCKSDPVPKVPLEAKKGILDLKNWDFQKDGNVYLDGEWTFSFEKNSKGFTTVPSQWQDHGFPLYGTAEYGLKILLPEKDGNEELAILLPDISM
ncbi:MAG TPA: hypothetical protein PL048_24360, partial [Leptospiraceae bacterium]|nr:hypothetical protein [Leptospiraceae bacterium]